MGNSDIEGSLAKISWWRAMLGGVTYRLDIYRQGIRLSSYHNQRIAWLEFGLIASVVIITIVLTSFANVTIAMLAQVLIYHIITMMLANASVGIIAVWGVHHDCDETIARTERNPLVNLLTFNLLYHVEHHLFPVVPSNYLPELAKRLDTAAPHLTKQHVLPSKDTIVSFIDSRWTKLKDNYQNNHDENDCPIRKRFV